MIDLTDSSGPAAPALEIADALHRAELAEQRAEAAERMAAERADRIADLQKALEAQGELIASTQRVLEASTVSGPLIGPTAPDHVAATDTPDQVSTVDTAKPKGKLRRWLFNES